MHSVCEQWNNKLDLKNNSLLNILLDIPRDKNILPQTIFIQKYPMVNFFKTTVALLSKQKEQQ